MKLLRLTLDSWRGVDHHEIAFVDEVTLIEGPNEVGKSTIVEAIHMLFKEMDSSNKQLVKAIQPVGRDVGSLVEAEVKTGDYHFVYTKTYNRGKQTSLNILAPKPEQLTGREAHERASQMLNDTIDTVLWDALLVEQGEKIAGANLSDSTGLAKALDAAAGTSSESTEDSALFTAVQAEYELYFTAKTGRSKYSDQENALQRLGDEVMSAKAALREVESDGAALERERAEVKRLEDALPTLKAKVVELDTAWKAIETLNERVRNKQTETDTANELYEAINSQWLRRQALVSKIELDRSALRERQARLAPEAEHLAALQQEHDSVAGQVKSAKAQYRDARLVAEQAAADEKHLAKIETLQNLDKQLEQLAALGNERETARRVLSTISIDENKLTEIREAERDLHTALIRRDASALQISVSAESDLNLAINDEQVSLMNGESEQRKTAAELSLHIPGVAAIQVSPSQSSAELEAEFNSHQTRFNRLLASAGVQDLADAVAVEKRRLSATQELARFSEQIESLLNGSSLSDLQTRQENLRSQVKQYIEQRPAQPPLPKDLTQASAATAAAMKATQLAEEGLTTRQDTFDGIHSSLEQRRSDYRVAEQEVRGLEAAAKEQEKQLADARLETTDADLEKQVSERFKIRASLTAQLELMQQQLEHASPETASTLLENARNSLARAEKDLQAAQQQCAVLEDRLTKAQADGRFEALEYKESKLASLENEYKLTCTRAEAARRLWETINKHRDNARKAYVRPLKEGIERLGKIVFGPDFSVELDDNWKLVSRTRDGKTIPFNDLSVGAKEQLGILTRLAAAAVVAEQGGVPLIIDDALGFSDPGRLESMGAAIASASKNCQIILLTCTPGRFMHVGNAAVVRL